VRHRANPVGLNREASLRPRMVAPGFLQNPEVRRWLNGIEPAWTMLEFNSLNALRHEPSASNYAIRLEANLSHTEISGSSVTANTLLLLRRAAEAGGLKLTATGNLSRAVVDEMFEIIQTPDYDKAELLRFEKVINEPDFLPLHFVRILTQAAKLFRTYRGKLVLTPLGRRMLALEQHDGPQAFGEFHHPPPLCRDSAFLELRWAECRGPRQPECRSFAPGVLQCAGVAERHPYYLRRIGGR
jgi:hypothetical protein